METDGEDTVQTIRIAATMAPVSLWGQIVFIVIWTCCFPFSMFGLCTDGANAMVCKTAGALAQIVFVPPNCTLNENKWALECSWCGIKIINNHLIWLFKCLIIKNNHFETLVLEYTFPLYVWQWNAKYMSRFYAMYPSTIVVCREKYFCNWVKSLN